MAAGIRSKVWRGLKTAKAHQTSKSSQIMQSTCLQRFGMTHLKLRLDDRTRAHSIELQQARASDDVTSIIITHHHHHQKNATASSSSNTHTRTHSHSLNVEKGALCSVIFD
jgi:hypothetical protein